MKKCSGKPFAKQLDSNILNIPAKDYLEYFFWEFDNYLKKWRNKGIENCICLMLSRERIIPTLLLMWAHLFRKIAFAGHKKATASDLEGLLNEENNNYKDIGNQYNPLVLPLQNNAMDRF